MLMDHSAPCRAIKRRICRRSRVVTRSRSTQDPAIDVLEKHQTGAAELRMCRKHGISEAAGRASCPPHEDAEITDAAGREGPRGHECAAEARLDASAPAPVARRGVHQGAVARCEPPSQGSTCGTSHTEEEAPRSRRLPPRCRSRDRCRWPRTGSPTRQAASSSPPSRGGASWWPEARQVSVPAAGSRWDRSAHRRGASR